MKNIYDQHDAAFADVSAYVIADNSSKRLATIAFKFPRDGAGRLYCYIHFIGVSMVRDYAGGYGYDKKSAAVTHAAAKIIQEPLSDDLKGKEWAELAQIAEAERLAKFKDALKDIGGKDWENALRDAGYTVLKAV